MSAAPTNAAPGSPQTPLVLARRIGAITHVTLNRPRAINALTSEMFTLLDAALSAAQDDGSRAILLDGAGERGFCGGGDVKEISSGDTRAILASEYAVDAAIASASVPVVAVMDGITMGGGIGLAGHAAVRIVTERSRLAMPEVRIGIVPDVGGHLLLAAAPGRLGEYLAVTAGEMTGGDAIALGFADFFVPSERLPALANALAAEDHVTGDAHTDVEAVVARFAEAAPPSALLAVQAWWDPIAEVALGGAPGRVFADPAGAALRLADTLAAAASPEAASTAGIMRAMSPTSVAITLAQIERTRDERLDLAQVLADDLRVLVRLGALPDFREGVRAQVIDKDRAPRWSPARLEDLRPEVLDAVLDPSPRDGERSLRPA